MCIGLLSVRLCCCRMVPSAAVVTVAAALANCTTTQVDYNHQGTNAVCLLTLGTPSTPASPEHDLMMDRQIICVRIIKQWQSL